jgi:hypothetical protein
MFAEEHFGMILNKNIVQTRFGGFEEVETFSKDGRGLGRLFKVIPEK